MVALAGAAAVGGALSALTLDRLDAALAEDGWRLVLRRTKDAVSVIDEQNWFVWMNEARAELAGVEARR